MSRVLEFTSEGMSEAAGYAVGLDDRDPVADVLEWTNVPGEGPCALLTYGGPTVIVTPDPLGRENVIVHYSHGSDRGVARVWAPVFADRLARLEVLDHRA